MSSFDSSEPRPLRDAILAALRAGQAEEPEDKAKFVLRYLIRSGSPDPGEVGTVLRDLAHGVSPYQVIGEFPIPGTSCSLIVPREVMPPGSETPAMIAAVREVARFCTPALFVDLGCGMGILGITALLANPGSRGVLIDLETAACEAAGANVTRLGLNTRAIVVRGDGLACLAPRSVGLLVANLPFVPTAQIASLPPRFGRYAPRRAVDGGGDGLDQFRRLWPQLRDTLLPGGRVVLQVGTGQKESVTRMMDAEWKIAAGWTGTHPNLIVAARICGDHSLLLDLVGKQ